MSMTRGDFLRSVAIGAGTAMSGGMSVLGFGTAPVSGGVNALDPLSLDERNRRLAEILSKDAFTRQLNTAFRLSASSSPEVVDAKLIEVRAGRSSEEYEQFSVLFAGPRTPMLDQKTYRVEHGEMGTFELFLVPIASDESGIQYEAVFNLRRA